MTPVQRRLRRIAAICACTAIVVGSNSLNSATQAAASVSYSSTARTIIVPVRTSQIKVAFDQNVRNPEAILSYSRASVPPQELLALREEVFPVVAHITGCIVAAITTKDQVLPDTSATHIPLRC